MLKGLIGALVVALAAAGIAVAEGGGATRPAPFRPFPQHAVGVPSQATDAAAAKVRPFSKVKYIESNTFNVGATLEVSGSLKCPKHSGAISGYFRDNKAGVVLDYSSVGGAVRKWEFGVLNVNTGGSAAKALVGVVCIK
jgi:hypothetical protein